jgi:hypothetical protein
MAIISDRFPPHFSNATQYVVSVLNERYPGLEVHLMRDMGFDGVIFNFRFRGEAETSTIKVDGNFLASASAKEIADKLIYHLEKYHGKKMSVVGTMTREPEKVMRNDWAENWIKKNGGVR